MRNENDTMKGPFDAIIRPEIDTAETRKMAQRLMKNVFALSLRPPDEVEARTQMVTVGGIKLITLQLSIRVRSSN